MAVYIIRNDKWELIKFYKCPIGCDGKAVKHDHQDGTCIALEGTGSVVSASWQAKINLKDLPDTPYGVRSLDKLIVKGMFEMYWESGNVWNVVEADLDGEKKSFDITKGKDVWTSNDLPMEFEAKGKQTLTLTCGQLIDTLRTGWTKLHDAFWCLYYTPEPPAPPPGKGTLIGSIKDASSKTPVYGVLVSANSNRVFSDSKGDYLIHLDPGTYTVSTSHVWYKPQSKQTSVDEDQVTRLDFDLVPYVEVVPIWVWIIAALAAIFGAYTVLKRRR